MTSKNQSNANQELALIGIVVVGIILYQNRDAILSSLVILFSWIFCLGLLGAFVYGGYCIYKRKPKRVEQIVEFKEGEGDLDEPEEAPKTVSPPPPATVSKPYFEFDSAKEQQIEYFLDTDFLRSKVLHRYNYLDKIAKDYVRSLKYEEQQFVPLGERQPQKFFIKRCPPESLEHTFVVQSIVEILKEYRLEVRTYATRMPDIVFTWKGKEHALEIETPLYLKKKHKRLLEKAAENNRVYGKHWWIVPTLSAYKRSFRRYGKVVTRNEVPHWIKQFSPPGFE